MKEALFWEAEEGGKVRCNLCRHRCLIAEGSRGICGVRENRSGVLYSLIYGAAAAQNVDPIEKKPLYHFLPGSRTFSVATRGCNFKCLHCQNCSISQVSKNEAFNHTIMISPKRIVDTARKLHCRSISYTYTEPTIFYEYAYDTSRIAADTGLKNVFVTNGYITPEALNQAAPYLDAANIDLKFFDDDHYRKICGARLQPVLDTIACYYKFEIWIEITTLIIPSYNDSDKQLQQIAAFIAGLSPDIPWHVTAFYPTYELTDVPPTPLSSLKRALEIGEAEGLKYIYPGNTGDRYSTRCPKCGADLITRSGFEILSNRIPGGRCPECDTGIAGVWA